MRKFQVIFYSLFLLLPKISLAAIPFVTDDAAISDHKQLLLETFTETWHLPKKGESKATNTVAEYIGVSYGISNNLEVTVGGLAGIDTGRKSLTLMNPIFQIKTIVYQSKKPEIPTLAVSAAYVNKNGQGQYYDPATNYYLMGIATSKFFDEGLIVHVNYGPKASYDISNQKNYKRMHLGVALDFALQNKETRFFVESYNGSQNSPRDSAGLFHSYQTGFKLLRPKNLSFHILYGKQPTFNGYDENGAMTYRKTSWVQFGIRKAFDNVF